MVFVPIAIPTNGGTHAEHRVLTRKSIVLSVGVHNDLLRHTMVLRGPVTTKSLAAAVARVMRRRLTAGDYAVAHVAGVIADARVSAAEFKRRVKTWGDLQRAMGRDVIEGLVSDDERHWKLYWT